MCSMFSLMGDLRGAVSLYLLSFTPPSQALPCTKSYLPGKKSAALFYHNNQGSICPTVVVSMPMEQAKALKSFSISSQAQVINM